MRCTIGLGEWDSPSLGGRRGNRKGGGIHVKGEGEKDKRGKNR